MKCAWKELISILPHRIRGEVEKYERQGLQEIRMRQGRFLELVLSSGSQWTNHEVSVADIQFTVNAASRYSPWSAATVQDGYITASGGHRIGLCGECVVQDGRMTGIRNVTSACIRVARDVTGIGIEINREHGSVLLLGPPGSGKTTLLRDTVRKLSVSGAVTVVDERGEVFPIGSGFDFGPRVDVLTNCGKAQGVISALRSMGPQWIAVDEITSKEDCNALLEAGWCGVSLLATAHARDKLDLLTRPVYQPIVKSGLFDTLVFLQQDKSWRMERM